MGIDEIMTRDVATCTPNDTVYEVAWKMKRNDCGLIPVIDDAESRSPVGIITDRDIICRVVAAGKDPQDVSVGEVMTRGGVTINYQATFNAALRLMEENRIRRLIVTSDAGRLIGVLSLTDLARAVARTKLGHALQEISRREMRP